ncbi:MAG: cytosine permease [Hyphomonadaceae bacterium]|nr:cytosine permease [Hyphomonadaceae bacterium]
MSAIDPASTDSRPIGDFAKRPVPENLTYSGFHIALIIVGGTIAIPVFIMGAQLSASIGFSQALPAFVLGCLILGVLGALTSYIGATSRYSAYMLTQFAFGRDGARIANLIVAISLIGWYGINANVFAIATGSLIEELYGVSPPIWIFVILGSVLMVGVTLSGFKGIDKLALILVPFLILFMSYAAVISVGDLKGASPQNSVITFRDAVSAVIGSYIVGVVIQPDYSRFARNLKHAMWAVFAALGVCFPVVIILAAIPAAATGEQDIIAVMAALGIGVPAFLLLLLGTWSSNVLSLYSSGLSIATILTRQTLARIVFGVGVLGTAVGLLTVQAYFVDFLILLGVAIPPIAAIYVVDGLYFRRGKYPAELGDTDAPIKLNIMMAWALGVSAGAISHFGIATITTIASIDSILVTTAACLLLDKLSVTRQAGTPIQTDNKSTD